ncbi:MAG: hypothetical protein KJO07_12990, partial [Deltaproteobacteria bacterium]|nr:hypothetical protein [Deltaproteobacteria bacterium]
MDRAYGKPVPALASMAPAWMVDQKVALAEVLPALKTALAAMEQIENDFGALLPLAQLMHLLVITDAAAASESCGGECIDLQIAAFRRIEGWSPLLEQLASIDGMILKLMQPMYPELKPEQIDEYKSFWRKFLDSSDARWRRLAVERLRSKGLESTVRDELLHALMVDRAKDELLDDARWFGERALAQGTRLVDGTRSWLAVVCYRQLDVACGDRYRKGLPEGESEFRRSNESIDEGRAHALAANQLQKRSDIKSRIALAEHYGGLLRYSDARAIADQLARKHPRDARPVVVKASILLDQTFDTRTASKLLKAADGFDNREDKFFQMRIGLVFEYLKPLLAGADGSDKELEASFDSLTPIVRDYAKINFDRGKMLELVLKLGRTGMAVQKGKASNAGFA